MNLNLVLLSILLSDNGQYSDRCFCILSAFKLLSVETFKHFLLQKYYYFDKK